MSNSLRLSGLLVLLVCLNVFAANDPGEKPLEWSLSSDTIRVALQDNGTIAAMEVKQEGQWEKISFRSDAVAGPSLALIDASPVIKDRKLEEFPTVKLTRVGTDPTRFAGLDKNIQCRLGYRLENGRLSILVSLKNTRAEVYSPLVARMVLGINCEQVKYPGWNEIYFPTLLRCEKTHCWGYLMTPRGRILTIGSPDPVASYAMNYKPTVWGNGNDIQNMCLRLYSCSLDLLHGLPLPQRHPQEMTALKPGEERNWRIYLQPANSLEQVKPMLAASLAAPMIDCDRYTLADGENCRVTMHGAQPASVSAIAPDGKETPLSFDSTSAVQHALRFAPQSGPGVYTLKVKDTQGHVAEACVSIRHPWSWYMNQARKESYHHKQYASTHLEQWLGLTTQVLARRHLPDPTLDPEGDKRLREILALQWDLEKKTPLTSTMPFYRLFPNTAQMAGLLAYRYMADGDRYWLDLAGGFADYCIGKQSPNGNLVNYTSVLYPAKSFLEVAAAEKMAMDAAPQMKANYARHYAAAKKAIDFLVQQKDNLGTEGGVSCYEDGMISCSPMQIGLFALLQKDPAERQKYAEAARWMLRAHCCLEQQLIPDSRMNGATLRFWEAQYNALMRKSRNMMDSPHGWGAWLIPGLWYQYLLTGEEQWLNKTMNAMGSSVQLIDSKRRTALGVCARSVCGSLHVGAQSG